MIQSYFYRAVADKKIYLGMIFFVAFFFVFAHYRGETSYNRMHDNGDGLVAYQMKYAFDFENGHRPRLFDSSMLGGLDRNINSFTSKLPTLIYTLFKPWLATYVHLFLQLFIGMVGIFLMLNLRLGCSSLVSFLASIVYVSLFPFYISEIFTISLVPLILYFITSDTISNIAIVFLALLYSWTSQISLAFYLVPFGLFFIFVLMKGHEYKNRFVLNSAKFMIAYLAIESLNLLGLLTNVTASQRSDWAWDTYGSGLNLDYLLNNYYSYVYYFLYVIFIFGLFWIKNESFLRAKKVFLFIFLLHIYLLLSGYLWSALHILGYSNGGFNYLRFHLTFPLLMPLFAGLLMDAVRKMKAQSV